MAKKNFFICSELIICFEYL